MNLKTWKREKDLAKFTLKNVMYTNGGGMQNFCWNASSKTHEWCEACARVSCGSRNGREGVN